MSPTHIKGGLAASAVILAALAAILMWPHSDAPPTIPSEQAQTIHVVTTPFGFIREIEGDRVTIETQFGMQTYRLADSMTIQEIDTPKTRADLMVGMLVSITDAANGVINILDIIPPPPTL